MNGEVVNKQFLSKAALDALKVSGGVQCGLLRTCMHMCKYHGGALIRQDVHSCVYVLILVV